MANERSRDQLIEEMEADGDDYFSAGRLNNLIDLSLSVLTVVGSLVATVLAGSAYHTTAPVVVAAVAAAPAATTSLQRIVRMRERSYCYFLFAALVRALVTELKYATSPDVEEFAKRRAKLEVDMEYHWAQIARPSESSSSRARNPEAESATSRNGK